MSTILNLLSFIKCSNISKPSISLTNWSCVRHINPSVPKFITPDTATSSPNVRPGPSQSSPQSISPCINVVQLYSLPISTLYAPPPVP